MVPRGAGGTQGARPPGPGPPSSSSRYHGAVQTLCPHPDCRARLDLADGLEWTVATCPSCTARFTVRPLDLVREVEKQSSRRRLAAPFREDLRAAPFTAVLEDVRSLWNVGSIFRTADGAGFRFLHLCGITGCPPDRAIAKTSLGAEEHVGWQHRESVLQVLPELSAGGVQIVALEKTASSEPLTGALGRDALRPPLCLVVGNEVRGLSIEALDRADLVCHLPMRGEKESLNVAVAFGVAGYAIRAALEGASGQPR